MTKGAAFVFSCLFGGLYLYEYTPPVLKMRIVVFDVVVSAHV